MPSPIIEEYIYELAKAIGDAYCAIKIGIGTETLPNTALFELGQLRSLTTQNMPYFGILKTNPSGFQIEPYQNDNKYIRVTDGQIGYNGNRISINSQLVPISRVFGSVYGEDYIYGVSIGFPIKEAQKTTQTFISSLTKQANAGDTVVYVDDISIAKKLGFPLKAYIDTEFVIFYGIDNTMTGLIVNINNGGIGAYKNSGSKIHFIYEPKIFSICGLPVDVPYQSGGNPKSFSYYPLMPTNWLPIANVLVKNPNNPKLLHSKPELAPVRVATTSEQDVIFESYSGNTLTLHGAGTNIIDGVELNEFDRVLIKDFPTGQKQYQGVYLYINPNTYIRASDLDSQSDFVNGLSIFVYDGIINKNLEFSYQGPDNPIVNPPTTALPFYLVTIDSFAVDNTKIEWQTSQSYNPIFNAYDAKTITAAIDTARSSLRQIRQSINVTDLILAFERYTSSISNNPNTTFNAYWASLPFRARNNFSTGVGYDNLYRMEFPASFAEAMYDIRHVDTQHTFAIFRGDMYAQKSAFNSSITPPSNVVLTPINVQNSTVLTKGVYSYGITSVNSFGESHAIYKSVEIEDNNFYMIEIKGNNVPSSSYYNIYRCSSVVGEQNEYLLNQYGSISGLEVPDDTSGTNIDLVGIGISSGNVYGIKFNANNGNLLGGVGVKIRKDNFDISNSNDYIDVRLYTCDGDNAAELLASGTPIYYKYITSQFAECISRFPPLNIGIGSTYYITLSMNRAPIVYGIGNTNLYLSVSVSDSTVVPGVYYGDSTVFDNVLMPHSTYIKTYGFLDNGVVGRSITSRGVKLTGNKSLSGRTISIFVPQIVLPDNFSSISIGVGATSKELPITKNGMNVTVIARLGVDGTPVTMSGYIPKGISANTRLSLTPSAIVDRVDMVYVTPSSNVNELTINSYGQIAWSVYDMFTIETTP